MRRTITMTAASIGLVIAFVVGGVAFAARPAAAGPAATSCIGIDIKIQIGHARTSSTSDTSTSTASSLDPSLLEVSDPSDPSASALFPPDLDVELCGPVVIIRR